MSAFSVVTSNFTFKATSKLLFFLLLQTWKCWRSSFQWTWPHVSTGHRLKWLLKQPPDASLDVVRRPKTWSRCDKALTAGRRAPVTGEGGTPAGDKESRCADTQRYTITNSTCYYFLAQMPDSICDAWISNLWKLLSRTLGKWCHSMWMPLNSICPNT